MLDIMKNSRLYKFLRKIAGDDVSITPVNTLEDCLDDIADAIEDAGSDVLPAVTGDDNGEILGVVDGGWNKMAAPIGMPASPPNNGNYYLINRVDTSGSLSYLGWAGIGGFRGDFTIRVTADEGGSLFYQLVNYLITYASTAGKNKAVLTIPEELLYTWSIFYQNVAGCPFLNMFAGDGYNYNLTNVASKADSGNYDTIELYAPDAFSSVAGYGIERIGMTPNSLYVVIYSIDAVTAPFPSV